MQIALASTLEYPPVLIYNEDRSIWYQANREESLEIAKHMEKLTPSLDRYSKSFWYAKLNKNNKLELLECLLDRDDF